MQQFSIYQTNTDLLIKALTLLVEKCYHNNFQVVILASDIEQQELLNKTLWTYSRKQFLPHGSKLDPAQEKQPIYITDEMKNPNNANVLLIMPPFNTEHILKNKEYIAIFQRVIIIYDLTENLEKIVTAINKSIELREPISCFKQTLNGSWTKI